MPRYIVASANNASDRQVFGADYYLVDTVPGVETPPNTIAVYATRELGQATADALNDLEETE